MALAKKLQFYKTVAWGAKNAENIFVKNGCASFWGDFSKNRKNQNLGARPKFKSPFREKRRASVALGQSIIAKKYFVFSRGIGKTNFPRNLIPPSGGESISGKNLKMALAQKIYVENTWPGWPKTFKTFLWKMLWVVLGWFFQKSQISKNGGQSKIPKTHFGKKGGPPLALGQ